MAAAEQGRQTRREDRGSGVGPLTEQQSALVRDNLGLVALHIRRHVRDLPGPRRDREWEDLFQEGCMGLAQAAAAYRPERGISFVAFALPRIHHAISIALQSGFATVRLPRVRRRGDDAATAAENQEQSRRPKVYGLSERVKPNLAARPSGNAEHPQRETIGQRLRSTYEGAVRAAQRELAGHHSVRGDLEKLAQVLAEERFLIPHEEARKAIRRIARETRSSFARVNQCEKRFTALVRRRLEADPQFAELRRLVRSHALGVDVPIDAGIERVLQSAEADELLRRYRRGSPTDRARLLHDVLRESQTDIEHIIKARLPRVSNRVRQKLLEDTLDLLAPACEPDREAPLPSRPGRATASRRSAAAGEV